MTLRRVRVRRAAAVLAASVLVVTLGHASTAAGQSTSPQAPDGATAPSAPLPRATELAPGTHEVVLVTGDVVHVTVSADGLYDVNVDTVARADGAHPPVEITAIGEDLYALPSDAVAYLDSGVLDRELFNVSKLVRFGYLDATPVIATGASGPMGTAAAPVGATVTRQLSSIDAVAATVDSAATWWAALLSRPASAADGATALAGVERIWLDELAEVVLADSVPQVGAPDAWEAGFDGTGVTVAVLDTGIDSDHPDLSGAVVAEQNFTADPDASDEHGHGTHVAGTVAGSGAASEGAYVGVAPGAQLLNAKVCNAGGSCPQSAIIDGMQWAADQGADVANLSIGGSPTDGTDPLSQAVDALTEQHDILFVVAAGNLGPGRFTVAAPGAATAALTVGAVAKSGDLAGFSSRGPRLGDHAIKPEITAPGVAITAARAAGTDMGEPVDDTYTTASGTSMATPHVAGAAAILAQAQPDRDAAALKAGLVASASDGGFTVYEQGAGLLNVGRAVDQQVRVSPATADFGLLPWPQEDPPVTRVLTYENPGDAPVTLDLALTAGTVTGEPLPDGALSLDVEEVTVPAGGTAEVTLTLDHTAPDTGLYTGRVVASAAGGEQLSTPVGFDIQEPQYTLGVTVPERDQVDTFEVINVSLFGVDGSMASESSNVNCLPGCPETIEFTVPAGIYQARAWVRWLGDEQETHFGVVIDPEVTVTGDTTTTLDPNHVNPVTFDTPRAAAPSVASPFSHFRSTADGSHRLISALSGQATDWWVAPTEEVTAGEFWTAQHWMLAPDHDGDLPYFYQVKVYEDARVPESLHYQVEQDATAVVDHHFHAEEDGTPLRMTVNARRDGEFAVGGFAVDVTGPTSLREYVWPLRDDAVHARTLATQPATFFPMDSALLIFDEPAHHDLRWNTRPAAPGPVGLPEGYGDGREDLNIVPFPFWVCVACRQGDSFYPFLHQISSQPGHVVGRYGHAENFFGQHYFLYRDGELLEPGDELIGAFTRYELAPEPADYRLVLDDADNQAVTEWEFSSQRVSDGEPPPGYWCLESFFENATAPCQAEPLIYLHYDAGVDIRNTVAGPGAHQVSVTVLRHAPAAPPVTGLELWFSTDDGTTWTPVRSLRPPPRGGDRYTATIVVPPVEQTSGAVSLRANAWDQAGNRVEQTIIGAYGLRERSAPPAGWVTMH